MRHQCEWFVVAALTDRDSFKNNFFGRGFRHTTIENAVFYRSRMKKRRNFPTARALVHDRLEASGQRQIMNSIVDPGDEVVMRLP
jgi:hypothetical protein